jgi:hypothetical protein
MRATAGRKGPSARPTTSLAQAKPAALLTRGKQMVGIDQPSLVVSAYLLGCYSKVTYIIAGIMIRGLYLDKSKAPGSCIDQ